MPPHIGAKLDIGHEAVLLTHLSSVTSRHENHGDFTPEMGGLPP